MDFSVIRPKPPFRRPQGPPPWAPAPPQPPLSGGPPPPPPPHRPPPLPHGKAPPPHTPVGPYMEEMDRLSRVQRMRSIEYTNARTWRMNFGEYPNDYSYHYGDYEYSHHPVGVRNYDHHHMLTGPSPRPALPPPDYHHALPGPPPRLGLPPPDYHHGPPAPPPANYYYPPPYNGGFFSDENPNGCMIM